MAGPRRALLAGPPRVVTLGLDLFALTLRDLRVAVVHVDWRPPAGGDVRLGTLLARLSDEREDGETTER
jgi:FdrA protein